MRSRHENPTSVVLMGFLGVLLGLVGSVVSAARTSLGPVVVPWGLVLAALTLAVAVRAVVWSTGTRVQGAVLLAGWVVATAAVLLVAPGGDVLLPGITRTYVYLASAFVLGLLALVWPLPDGHAELLETEAALVPGDNVLPAGDLLPPSGEGTDVR